MKKNYSLDTLKNICLPKKRPLIVFLNGELGSGKTTLSGKLLSSLGVSENNGSPTYVYYNKYGDHYHFDLYRIESYDHFVNIGGEEVLDLLEGVAFIEWPEVLEGKYTPDVEIYIEEGSSSNERSIEIILRCCEELPENENIQ